MGYEAWLYIEYYGFNSKGEEGWQPCSNIICDRSQAFALYEALNKSRKIKYHNKGIPKNVAFSAFGMYTHGITKSEKLLKNSWGYITREQAEQKIKDFPNEVFWWDDKQTRIYQTHLFDTWLTYNELDDLITRITLPSLIMKLNACSAMMRVLSDGKEEHSRLVLWLY